MSRIIKAVIDSRIIVVSDIHCGLVLFKELLKKVALTEDDTLIILGDFLQRGPDNIQTLDYIKKLVHRPNTYVLSGNHEHYICSLLENRYLDRLEYHMNHIHYGCILKAWIKCQQITYKDLEDLQVKIKALYKSDLDFLKSLPYVLETDDYIFVHGGINGSLEHSTSWDLLSTPEFLLKGHLEKRMVIVGHWPVQNYKESSMSGDIIIDKEKRIISLDGGFGVKKSGQINALVIDQSFNVFSMDGLKSISLNKNIASKHEKVVKLDYQDKVFTLIEQGEAFSTVKKNSTGEIFLLINEYLETDFEDYISLFIYGNKGDQGKLIREVGDYALIKISGEIGWVKRQDIDNTF